MPYIAVAEDNSAPIELYYEDHGAGPAVVLVHDFPSSGRSWENQVVALYRAGFRVIAYDRRGFGQSSMPAFGYDFDTLAADLRGLIATLELRDVALVGCGMGGGDIARYIGRYGTPGVRRVAFIASITPGLDTDAEGMACGALFDAPDIQLELDSDRYAFARSFIAEVYNADVGLGSAVSRDKLERDAAVAAAASPLAMLDFVAAWRGDFRTDLARIDVPSLIVHGDCDRIAPLAHTARRAQDYLLRSTLTVLEGAPHGLIWTHATSVNAALLEFLR
jgi:pimeloyl-ACP methyl ester carboxylesterase